MSFVFSGIYSLLLLSLCFNFLLAIRMHILDKKIDGIDKRSREEVELMEKRLKFVKEQITEKKGLIL